MTPRGKPALDGNNKFNRFNPAVSDSSSPSA
jgi:hypothetical protein